MEKALKVIASCKTLEQWNVAVRYVDLFLTANRRRKDFSINTARNNNKVIDALHAKLFQFVSIT